MWGRRSDLEEVVAWRAPRDAVREVLRREEVPAALGPYRDGWALARLLVVEGAVLEPGNRFVVDLVDDLARSLGAVGAVCLHAEWGALHLVVCSGTSRPVWADLPAAHTGKPADRAQWVEVLRSLGRLDHLEALVDAAARGLEPGGVRSRRRRVAITRRDPRPRLVAAAAGLPAALVDPALLGDPDPAHEVVVCRGFGADDLRVTVSAVASAVGHPLRFAELPGCAVVTAQPVTGPGLGPVAAGLARGSRPALLLWRQGDARGYQLWHRGEAQDAHVWGSEWELLPLSRSLEEELAVALTELLAPASGDAELLIRDCSPGRTGSVGAAPGPDPAVLRSVLRRPVGSAVLAGFCELLGIDAEVAAVVEGERDPATLAGSSVVERGATARAEARALLQAVTTPRPDDPWFVRAGYQKPWWYRVANAVWVPVALLWAVRAWPGGAPGRAGAVLLVLTAAVSAASAVLPARSRAREQPGPAAGTPPEP